MHGCAAVADVELFELDGQVLFGGGRGDLAAVNGWFANGFARGTTGPIGIRCAPPDAARIGRSMWKRPPLWRHRGEVQWREALGHGQIGPVLVSVLFTLNTVTKLNMCQGLRPAPHLDTVPSAPASGYISGQYNISVHYM